MLPQLLLLLLLLLPTAAGALALGYANIFVTAPSPENLRTLFDFVFKGLDAAGYQEHIDYDLVESTNPEWGRAVVRVNVFRAHRQVSVGCVCGGGVLPCVHKALLVCFWPGKCSFPQNIRLHNLKNPPPVSLIKCFCNTSVLPLCRPFCTAPAVPQTVQYIQPHHAAQRLGQAELLVIDEAAAIPLPMVKAMLGPYLVFMCSTGHFVWCWLEGREGGRGRAEEAKGRRGGEGCESQ
jgi:tRNA(Met) C34 N-acetyltransferase TmcA